MAKRKNDFEEFMKEVAKDSGDAGQTEAFDAYGEHFRLALQVIRMRKAKNWTQQQLAKASGPRSPLRGYLVQRPGSW